MAIAVAVSQTLAVKAVNLALLKIGVSQTVASLDENTRAAFTGKLLFDHEFRACLRQFPWPFATKYKNLALVAGTSTVAINGDWQYAYEYPADCVFARRVVPPGSTGTDLFGVVIGSGIPGSASGREFAEQPPGTGIRTNPVPFRQGREGDVRVLYTNANQADSVAPSVWLEYTAIFDCPEELVDELFMSALSWRVAAALAPSLSKVNAIVDKAWTMYLHTIDTAAAVASREGQQQANGEAESVRVR